MGSGKTERPPPHLKLQRRRRRKQTQRPPRKRDWRRVSCPILKCFGRQSIRSGMLKVCPQRTQRARRLPSPKARSFVRIGRGRRKRTRRTWLLQGKHEVEHR